MFDGCFLKGYYGGTILAIIDSDLNDQILFMTNSRCWRGNDDINIFVMEDNKKGSGVICYKINWPIWYFKKLKRLIDT
jgi:hypothetical protein